MLDVKYSWDEMELVKKIKFNFAPIQIYEYTKDRMMDLLDCGLYSNEEFIKMVRKDFDNPLDILDFDNDNANGGSLYFYTEPAENGYIRGFDTMEETIDFCIMWLYTFDGLDYDFEYFINSGNNFDIEKISNDYFRIVFE